MMIAEDLEDEESPYGRCTICGDDLQEDDYNCICRKCDGTGRGEPEDTSEMLG